LGQPAKPAEEFSHETRYWNAEQGRV